ncbi:MAG: two-component system response regulator [Elusimicrobia bacterium CG08_land_8_20_14_0_20_59_10]|nr:MAG: two-component system response regulator [Elusimicrobia bacterium CG08_land_8_20_14_0_20_59_10]
MKVLIVDDNLMTRRMISDFLGEMGHEVVGEAGDGDSALKAFAVQHPELVLLDIIMPGISGVEVLEKMRKLDPAARIVMITAVEQEGIEKQLHKLGVTAILYKPFSYGEFKETIKKCTG